MKFNQFDTLMLFLKGYFQIRDLEKISRKQKSKHHFPVGKELMISRTHINVERSKIPFFLFIMKKILLLLNASFVT